jgi:tRNA threonylcarbamoyl adenosine modification protein YeaZ
LRPDPLVLGLDTAAAHCAAAVVSGDRVLAAREEAMPTGQADRLVPLVESLLAEAGLGWRDLDGIGVGTGPGNFTGVRIGVALARGLALGLGVPAIGVTAFEALALGRADALLVRDARLGQVHLQRAGAPDGPVTVALDGPWGPWPPVPPGLAVVGDRAEEVAARVGGVAERPVMPIAEAVARVALSRLGEAGPRPAPLYLRAPDAAPPRDPRPPSCPDDARGALDLHAAAFAPERPWSAGEFAGLLASPGALLLGDGRAALLARVTLDEAEVLTLATSPLHRRQGPRARPAPRLPPGGRAARRHPAVLEVAEGNAAARALYGGAGYERWGRRPAYYARAGEAAAALILARPPALTSRRLRTGRASKYALTPLAALGLIPGVARPGKGRRRTGAPSGEAPSTKRTGSAHDPAATDGATAALALGATAALADPAVIFDLGGKFDKSFNESSFNGATRWAEETGGTFAEFELTDRGAARAGDPPLRRAGQQPDHHGGLHERHAARTHRARLPETTFVLIDAVVDQPNVRSVVFNEHEGSYLVGLLAGWPRERHRGLRGRHGHPAHPQVRLRLRPGRGGGEPRRHGDRQLHRHYPGLPGTTPRAGPS